MALTDTACKNARCGEDRPYQRFSDAGGLYLEVTAAGSKLWRWKYRFNGKEKRLAIGMYPEISLAQARRARDDARDLLKAGTDPVQAKADRKLADRVKLENTFESVARAWYDHWKGSKSPRHADYVLRRLEADVFPELGRRPIADITAPQLLAVAKKIESRGAVDIAKRAWQTCGQIFRYGLAHGLLERNPATDVKPSDALKPRKKAHFARLDAKEMPELLRKIEAYAGTPVTRLSMKLMALTFVRTGELIGAHWDEFDLEKAKEWRIPAERMKMKTPHIVPLSKQAIEVLQTIHELRGLSGLLFPGERDHDKPMSNNTILAALKRMGYGGRMTGHGFRGVASTILHELGHRHDIIELQLAHQERDDVSAAYNFATYLPQRRKMMQAWADHLDMLRAGAKVIPFKAA
ncbi:integrase arm-type DNA-binding domain-containing protein [Variovorax dokdonensis]|uniref:Integrase arm-type DNA-binding domain-containing protein n=1 Tax=Variovorax dokdonensis TaxID=344883 RepID=A0ABT7N732_9BURK|nr:integrase arm-type DNA-binding domain-containing protein [Variovorax dokdonensis]MDM0043748.1 integrase arm-type DNA-binding domain-containing protein [Variovorax dokdonensis]